MSFRAIATPSRLLSFKTYHNNEWTQEHWTDSLEIQVTKANITACTYQLMYEFGQAPSHARVQHHVTRGYEFLKLADLSDNKAFYQRALEDFTTAVKLSHNGYTQEAYDRMCAVLSLDDLINSGEPDNATLADMHEKGQLQSAFMRDRIQAHE